MRLHMNLNKSISLLLFCLLCVLQGSGGKIIFYLHGAIVEVQGANAVDTKNGYGAYKYLDILDSLRSANDLVISEVRKPGTEAKEYAEMTANKIDSLIKTGNKASDITVVGASKGAVI